MRSTVAWRALLEQTTRRLTEGGLASPVVDARRLVEEASGHEGVALVLGLDDVATERPAARLDAMVARRLAGEPLQYVLGRWGFRTLDVMVDRRVLIPRPETEQVVTEALVELDRRLVLGVESTVVDLGSGSGAIGLSIAVERPGVAVWCVDAWAGAVAVTRSNLAGLGMAGRHVRVLEGSWFDPLPADLRGRIALIVTNPPYVAADEVLPVEVAEWEPRQALVPGPTGLEAIEVILAGAPAWLAADGVLVAEIGATQAPRVLDLANRAGFRDAEVRTDLNGRDRTLVARTGS